uniref:Uncharacterized protein n=1 Tax=Anguilla anguilla TaxID=7936 RepID=A0A0E9QX49_ANGAN
MQFHTRYLLVPGPVCFGPDAVLFRGCRFT